MSDHEVHSDHPHEHGDGCGHTAVMHGDHVDYLHDGHLHHPHGDHVDYLVGDHLHHPHEGHCDEHGVVEVTAG